MVKLRTIEKILVSLTLLILSDAVVPLVITRGGDITSDVPYRPIMHGIALLLYTICLGIIIYKREVRSFLKLFVFNKGILSILLLVFCSLLWTTNSFSTLQSTILLLLTTIFSVYVVYRFDSYDFLELIGYTFGAMAIAAICFVLIPGYGITPEGVHAGNWRGVYLHKNGLGLYMALGSVLFFVLAHFYKKRLYWLVFFIALILILMSKSGTAVMAFFFIYAGAYPLGVLLKKKKLPQWVTLSVGAVLMIMTGYFLLTNFALLLKELGKDPTLTGRLYLWDNLIRAGNTRPWLGYGYSGFWLQPEGSLSYLQGVWDAGKSHNAFLDVWIDLGFIGLFLFLSILGNHFLAILKGLRVKYRPIYLWHLLFYFFLLIVSIADFRILQYNSLIWTLFVITSYYQVIENKYFKEKLAAKE